MPESEYEAFEVSTSDGRADVRPGSIEELQAVLEVSELGTEVLIEEGDPRNAAIIQTRRLVAKALREKIAEMKKGLPPSSPQA